MKIEKRMSIYWICCLLTLLQFCDMARANRWRVYKLTRNGYDDTSPKIANGTAVWLSSNKQGDSVIVSSQDGGPVTVIRDSIYAKSNIDISDTGTIVWQEKCGSDKTWEIYAFSEKNTTRITNNSYDDILPKAGNNIIAWQAKPIGGNWDIFLKEGAALPINLSNNSVDDGQMDVYDNKVVWISNPSSEGSLYYYNGSLVECLVEGGDHSTVDPYNTGSLYDISDRACANPSIGSFGIAWEQCMDIYKIPFDINREIWNNIHYYHFDTGTINYCGSDEVSRDTQNPDVGDQVIVWQEYNRSGGTYEIWARKSLTDYQISKNEVDDVRPIADAGVIVWEGINPDTSSLEIFVYDIDDDTIANTHVFSQQLSNSDAWNSMNPDIDAGKIVWQSWDGNDWEIMMAVQCSDSDSVAADFNNDCIVDMNDFAFFCQQWLACDLPDGYCD